MKRLLQRFGFKESRYERPNQKWVCGATDEGKPCLHGPNGKGRCGATSECVPLRKGDRWHCTRPAAAGGPCPDGPAPDGSCCRPGSPCAPVRSVRARRVMVTQLTVAFTCGLLLLLLGGSDRWRFLSPGPLTTRHAMSEATCADCHGMSFAKDDRRSNLFEGIAHASLDSERCLNCHQLGPQPLAPHSLSLAKLIAVTAQAKTNPVSARPPLVALSASIFGGTAGHGGQLACGACHQEHLGKAHSLTTLGNSQCQGCHQGQFKSFAEGHPNFRSYPYPRRTRIFFDHESHLEKHFQNAQYVRQAPQFCTGCHETDSAGRAMLVKDFATTCAACHLDQIRGEGRADGPGLAVFGVPGLDARTLRERGRPIGDWPEQAEGRLNPFMQLLLAGDPANTEALARLAKTDWLDLGNAKEEELQAAEKVAWAIKELFFELVTKGQSAWRVRLQAVLGQEPNSAEFTRLAGQLPPDSLQAAQAEWFPNLLAEVPAHRAGNKPPSISATPKAAHGGERDHKAMPQELWAAHGGWYRSPNEYALHYRPAAHADEFMRSWLDLAASAATSSSAPLPALFKSLAAPKAPGFCIKCHSVDGRSDGNLVVNWLPARPVQNEHPFTKFSHRSHFSLLDQRGCLDCHRVNHKAEYQKAFENNTAPEKFTSNFAPMNKAVCTACHTPDGAGDNCLKCHEYHVGNFTPTLSQKAQSRRMNAAPAKK